MKNWILFILVFFVGCTGTRMASNNLSFPNCKGDTALYLKHNFIEQKQKYIGKKLNVLLKDLDIPVKSYFDHTVANNISISDAMYLSFLNDADSRATNNKLLIIIWETPLPTKITDKLILEHPEGWGKAEIDYFGQQIIKDIKLNK